MLVHDLFESRANSIRSQIIQDVDSHGPGQYFVRFTDIDKLGYSARQQFGRSPDVDDPEFSADYIGTKHGRPAIWFYPLNYYLKQKDSYATDKPYAWLVKLNDDAWLQPVDRKTTGQTAAPLGRQRVGLLRNTTPPAAIFFRPAFQLIGKYYDYAGQHQRHGQVKGAPDPSFFDRVRGLTESSGYTLEGSWTPDLVFSKLWAIRKLQNIVKDSLIPVIYVLGSWYGNMSVLLARSGLNIGKIINVESNPQWLNTGNKFIEAMGIDNVESMNKDANTLDYRQLPGVVINSSTNDMENRGWFDNIPPGTLVVIQGRNKTGPKAVYSFDSPQDLQSLYQLNKVLYSGSLDLEDPETNYTRNMIIGIR